LVRNESVLRKCRFREIEEDKEGLQKIVMLPYNAKEDEPGK
jgi:hypothetical protein